MSTQIAVRLADSLVAELDRVVASGRARSRASLVEAALERELRRLAAVSDAETLGRVGTADDLDGLVEWAVGNVGVEE
jgi:Arc/MetJ-type ribon-helix-helix transcriptional regulator